MDSDTSLLDSHGRHPVHPGAAPGVPIGNATFERSALNKFGILMPRGEGEEVTRSADSVAVIFRYAVYHS